MHGADVRGDFGAGVHSGEEAEMTMRCLFLLCACIVMCLGCSTTVVVREDPDRPAMAEALIDFVKGTKVQTVEGAWKDEAFVAECVLKCDGEKLTLVLLAPQMRLATLTIERPHRIRWERAPQLPSSLDPEYILFDLALVLLPTDDVRRMLLDDGFRVDETADGKRRMVVDADRGKLHSVRQILPGGDVYFRNVRYGYEYTVKAISHES